jgi:hypothetical protein
LSTVYPSAVYQFERGNVDVLADTIKAQLVTASYVYSAAHDNFNDVVAGRVGPPVGLTIDAISDGTVYVADPVVFPAVAGGSTVVGIVIFRDTGTESSSTLLAHVDEKRDRVPLSIETNGGNITLTWSRLFKL